MTIEVAIPMIEALRQRRLQQAAEAASLLYHAGARRVWLFGSVARRDIRDKRSDLDLAVEGLDENQIRNLRTALRMQLRCKVDVVSMDHAVPELRQGILRCRVPVSREACRTAERLALSLPHQPPTASDFPQGLQDTRLQAVMAALLAHGASTIIDLGCGPGMLLERLAAEPSIKRVLGVDMSMTALEKARRRMGLLPHAAVQGRISLLQALVTNPDPRFLGFGAVTAVEVIEHLDIARLAAFGRVVFGYLRPALVILTTPNFEYNVRWNFVPALRHKDHHFELTRSEFKEWVSSVAGRQQYACEFDEIGTSFGKMGGPTQMATCSRLADERHLWPLRMWPEITSQT
jgi:predicted nucleotidyltransferase/SAM-dependent methyltransferase